MKRVIREVTGTPMTSRDPPVEEYPSWLQDAGRDEVSAPHFVAALDASIVGNR